MKVGRFQRARLRPREFVPAGTIGKSPAFQRRDISRRPFGTVLKREAKGNRENETGFTLIEVVVSAALMAIILVCAYLCLSACLASQKTIEPRADVLQNARVAMALMTGDLRNACPLSSDNPFLGMQRMLGQVEADNLDFATHNYTPRQPRESDYCEVSYYVDKDPDSGQYCLYRRRNPTLAPDPLSGGTREEIAQGVLGVRFEYFDGTDWYDTWGNAEHPENTAAGNAASLLEANDQGMPEAVRITLLLDSDPQSKPATDNETPPQGTPLVFQSVVRLVLADRYQSGGGNSRSSF
jgi:type II secretion system protein J